MFISKLRDIYKTWLISGDVRTFTLLRSARDHTAGSSQRVLATQVNEVNIRCGEVDLRMFLRQGTSDFYILKEVFLNHCYQIPAEVSLGANATIVDIGANVGLASLYLRSAFPTATIHAFEPVRENFEALRRNTEGHPGIHIHNCVVSSRDGMVPFSMSSEEGNQGAGGIDPNGGVEMASVSLGAFCRREGVQSLDVIKVDCEGGEYEILFGLDTAVLSKVKLIIGEIHGPKAWGLLEYLGRWFDIGVHKEPRHLNLTFAAVNRSIMVEHYGVRSQPLAEWFDGRGAVATVDRSE